MRRGGRVVRLFGIEVTIHRGWLLGLVVATAVLALAGLPAGPEDRPAPLAWAEAALLGLSFIASLLLHDVAHVMVARRLGLRPRRVSLFAGAGGTGALDPETERPTDEVLVAAGGPAVSLAAGTLLAGSALAIAQAGGEGATVAANLFLLVGAMNGVLGGLNLVPAFPFDGGRILRAILWRSQGDFLAATRTAANTGRAIGFMGIGAGFLVVVGGDPFVGLTVVLVGWLLTRHAGISYRWAAIQRYVVGLSVGQVMDRQAPAVFPSLTLDVFVDQYLMSGSGSAFAVASGGELIGTIDVEHARRVPRGSWPTRRVADEMVLLPNVETAGEDDPLWPAIERFEREHLRVMPVVDGSRLLGVLTREGLLDTIRGRMRPAAS